MKIEVREISGKVKLFEVCLEDLNLFYVLLHEGDVLFLKEIEED